MRCCSAIAKIVTKESLSRAELEAGCQIVRQRGEEVGGKTQPWPMRQIKAPAERDLMGAVQRTRAKVVSWVAEIERGVNEVLVSGHAVEARQGVGHLETPIFQSARKIG